MAKFLTATIVAFAFSILTWTDSIVVGSKAHAKKSRGGGNRGGGGGNRGGGNRGGGNHGGGIRGGGNRGGGNRGGIRGGGSGGGIRGGGNRGGIRGGGIRGGGNRGGGNRGGIRGGGNRGGIRGGGNRGGIRGGGGSRRRPGCAYRGGIRGSFRRRPVSHKQLLIWENLADSVIKAERITKKKPTQPKTKPLDQSRLEKEAEKIRQELKKDIFFLETSVMLGSSVIQLLRKESLKALPKDVKSRLLNGMSAREDELKKLLPDAMSKIERGSLKRALDEKRYEAMRTKDHEAERFWQQFSDAMK